MTGQELKDDLMRGCPVIWSGLEYSCVSAIIYRNVHGKIKVAAELLDQNDNSVVIVPAERVEKCAS